MLEITRPIVIYSFSRPEILASLCLSLRAQQGVAIDPANIHLFQDGAVSPRSGMRYAPQSQVDACVSVFKAIIPEGQVHVSPENLGIAMNIHRGEDFVFRTCDQEAGFFFEDDLELGPAYLLVLERMAQAALQREDVGYFAAYGNHKMAPEPTLRFVPLEHHWGYGLTRRCWRDVTRWLDPFYAVWRSVDYKSRPHLRIVECYEPMDVAADLSSQDVAKTAACASLGYARVNTNICYARYTGREGQSFRAENFTAQGYDRMTFVVEPPETLPPMDDATIRPIAEARRRQFQSYRRDRFDARLAEMRRAMANPDRAVTRQDVDTLWIYLLDRLPANEAYYEGVVGKKSVRELRSILMTSEEGLAKSSILRKAMARAS